MVTKTPAPEIFVRFMCVQNSVEELYRGAHGKVYVRQPANINGSWYKGEQKGKSFWLSSCKWQGGYEADCPLKDGLIVNVQDKYGQTIFRETLHADNSCGGTSAEQSAPFAWEIKKHIAEQFAKEYELSDYDTWKTMLCWERARHEYKGYVDNWLYCEVDTLKKKTVKRVTEYGMTFRIIEELRKHRISGTVWTEYYLVADTDEVCEEICGYDLP